MPVLPEIVDEILGIPTLVGALLFFQPGCASGQENGPTKTFLLEDPGNSQWCAYNKEATWNTAVQDAGAMTVGTLTYLKHRLLQIDVTETDESGDWTVYDHYFLNGRGEVVKLSRTINVLPGDRSVLQTYAISNGKAKKTTTTEKQLSTGKLLASPKSEWLPDLPIKTETKQFPFSGLLGRSSPTTSSKYCVP